MNELSNQRGTVLPSPAPRRRAAGLRAILLVAVVLFALSFLCVRGLYPFLAVNAPIPGGIIAVEGWIHDIDVSQSIDRIDPEHKCDIYVVCAIHPPGPKREWELSHAGRLEQKLRTGGVLPERLQMVFYDVSKKDRTYHTAMALKTFLRDRGRLGEDMNVITSGPHARRSRLLFQKAFGRKVRVGVLPNIDGARWSRRWWHSRWGLGHMAYQVLAYVYAKLFFRP